VNRERDREIEERKREKERLPTRKRSSLLLLLIFFYLPSAGQIEREIEKENELGRKIERVLEEDLRCLIQGMDWVPFIVVWTAKIVQKQSYPTARKKIWKDLVLKFRFLEIWCMNLFLVEVDRSTVLVDRSTYCSSEFSFI
jgi:hypothetical protein